MLFFICHIYISGRFYLFFLKYEYFCKRFTGGIFNYRQDESTNINKREGKRKVALYHAFHTSLPIMAGYGFLGLTTLKVRTTLRLSPRRAEAEH